MRDRPVKPPRRKNNPPTNSSTPSTSTAPEASHAQPLPEKPPKTFTFNFSAPSLPQRDVKKMPETPRAIADLSVPLAKLRFGDATSTSCGIQFNGLSQRSLRIRQIDQRILRLQKNTVDDSSDEGGCDKIFALRKERNALIPLEGLPTELFLDIIRDVVDGENSPSLKLMKLVTVSSWWRNVISDYPALWSVIVYDCPSTYISLRLSDGALLDVRMPKCYSRPHGHLKQFVEAVGPRAERWKSLEFNGNEKQFQILQPFLTGSLPYLKHLVLTIPGLAFLDAFPTDAPLDRLSLQWTSLAPGVNPSNLKILRLGCVYEEEAPTASRILDMVEQCPDLQELQLWTLHPEGGENDLVQRHDNPILLPHLHTLELKDVAESFATTILRGIQAPGLTSSEVDVETVDAVRLLRAFLPENPAMPSISPLLLLSKGANTVMDVSAGSGIIQITLHSALYHLDFKLRRRGQTADLSDVITALGPYMSQASEVHLELEGPLQIPSRLDVISNMTKLIITLDETTKRIVEYLSQSTDHCPRLEHLHSELWWDPSMIEALAHARRTREGGPGLKIVWGPLDK